MQQGGRRVALMALSFFALAMVRHLSAGDGGDDLPVVHTLQPPASSADSDSGSGTAAPVRRAKPTRRTPAPVQSADGGGTEPTPSDLDGLVNGGGVTAIKQIHHGIYMMVSQATRARFALKTECRPAAKWHGQQGWTEVAVHHFSRLFFAGAAAAGRTVPSARGRTGGQAAAPGKELHSDQCGVVKVGEDAGGDRLLGVGGATGTDVVVVGMALQWRAKHNDNALPARSTAALWRGGGAALPAAARRAVAQLSDVTVLDYALENEDREDKNWFHDAGGNFIAMDNGWAFAGRAYRGSVCSADEANLRCPPLLRYLSGSARCAARGAAGKLGFCRFRRSTVARVRRLTASCRSGCENGDACDDAGCAAWGAFSATWRRVLDRDPVIAWLLRTYGRDTVTDKHGRAYNMGLARYTHGCANTTAAAGVPWGGQLTRWLAGGVLVRLRALSAHVAACVDTHGEDYVYGGAPRSVDTA
jgi:hypothetical protein